MTVVWANSAKRQLRDILAAIRDELSPEDASAWLGKFMSAAELLEEFPDIGAPLSVKACNRRSEFFQGLRQLLVGPYRIVYERTSHGCAVLFCQHCRQMVGTEGL